MKTNPWLHVDIENYEGHMATPEVGQAALLAAEFKFAVECARPQSLALVGCAGGNGLDALIGKNLESVVCVDINPAYLEKLSIRYKGKIQGLETICTEVETFSFRHPLDLIFGGLIFEYTRLDEALSALSHALRRGGKLVALVQMKSVGVATVSSSPYAETLTEVGAAFNYIDPDTLSNVAAERGLDELSRKVKTLASGKSFSIIEYLRA
jgi:SAM-dependent methyltransferase